MPTLQVANTLWTTQNFQTTDAGTTLEDCDVTLSVGLRCCRYQIELPRTFADGRPEARRLCAPLILDVPSADPTNSLFPS